MILSRPQFAFPSCSPLKLRAGSIGNLESKSGATIGEMFWPWDDSRRAEVARADDVESNVSPLGERRTQFE